MTALREYANAAEMLLAYAERKARLWPVPPKPDVAVQGANLARQAPSKPADKHRACQLAAIARESGRRGGTSLRRTPMKKWTTAEENQLIILRHTVKNLDAISCELGRSYKAIKMKLEYLRLNGRL